MSEQASVSSSASNPASIAPVVVPAHARALASAAGRAAAPAATATPGRTSLGRRALYGAGEIAVGARLAAFGMVLFPFYTDVALLPPALVGLAIALGRVWDGVNDPITGWLSDRTRTRFGRRRPYLALTILPLTVAFAAIWMPPPGSSSETFLYLLAGLFFFDVFFGFYSTPYLALGAELSQDYDDRARVVTTRAIFHNLGLLAGGGGFLALAAGLGGGREGYRTAGIALAALMLLGGVVAILGTREPEVAPEKQPGSLKALLADLLATLKLRSFRIILLGSGLAIAGSSLNQAFTLYVFRDAYGAVEAAGLGIAIYLLAATISFPFWSAAAARFGKNVSFVLCLMWSVVALSLAPLFDASTPLPALLAFIVIAGLGVGGYVLPLAIVADVCDEDELVSERRREGAIFGVWTLVMKLAAAFGIALAGVLLPQLGYEPGLARQSPDTVWWLKLAWGPFAACFFVATLLVVRKFPLSREKHGAIQEALRSRAAAGTPS